MNKTIIAVSLVALHVGVEVGIAQNVFPSTGNAGIGTTTPGSKLDVRKSTSGVGVFVGNRTPFGAAGFETDFDAPAAHAWFAENGNRVFSVTGGGQAFFGGNIDMSPGAILSSSGRLHVQSFADEPLFLNPFAGSGNVHIGGGGGAGHLVVGGGLWVDKDVRMGPSTVLSSSGRLHVQSFADEPLFINPFAGGGNVHIGGGGGSGNLVVGGGLWVDKDFNMGPSTSIRSSGRLHIQSAANEPLFLNPWAGSGAVTIGGGGGAGNLSVVGGITCTVLDLTSDRNQKTGFAPVNAASILHKVLGLEVATWNYTNTPTVQHIGPMAQDFMESFGYGDSDKHISVVDALGIQFAALQGLNQKLEEALGEKEARIALLEKAMVGAKNEFAARLERMEKLMAETSAPKGESDRAIVTASNQP